MPLPTPTLRDKYRFKRDLARIEKQRKLVRSIKGAEQAFRDNIPIRHGSFRHYLAFALVVACATLFIAAIAAPVLFGWAFLAGFAAVILIMWIQSDERRGKS